MKMPFYKYQSLENHFILFELSEDNQLFSDYCQQLTQDKKKIIELCYSRRGIGADGILLIKKKDRGQLDVAIFNADGTSAENCLNGLRCVVLHWAKKYKNSDFLKLDLFMGHKKTEASYDYRSGLINTACEAAQIKDKKEIDLSLSEKISGTLVSVGNPHFVIQEKKEPLWLLSYGSAIEKHNFFPEKTNVELLIKREKGLYELFIHERGVGYTAACGSGAAAATWLLFEQKEIQREEKISISMPGGTLISWITKEQKIALEASAQLVFDGFLTIDEAGY